MRLVVFIVFILVHPFGGWAGAVVVDKKPATPKLGDTKTTVHLPVAWEMMRSQFRKAGLATLSESFRERWTLEQDDDGARFLQSPRARVSVLVQAMDGKPLEAKVITLDEFSFGQLIGIPETSLARAENENGARVVSLDLTNAPKGGQNLILHLSEETFYEVHVELGTKDLAAP